MGRSVKGRMARSGSVDSFRLNAQRASTEPIGRCAWTATHIGPPGLVPRGCGKSTDGWHILRLAANKARCKYISISPSESLEQPPTPKADSKMMPEKWHLPEPPAYFPDSNKFCSERCHVSHGDNSPWVMVMVLHDVTSCQGQ